MPVLHRRINKHTFGDTLEKVSSRLAGWKGRFLSLAGRLTLTKAVLSSIPVHSMSTILLPKSILARLDQVSRSFLWGSTTEHKKQHLIAWKRVCLPKQEGGLGIRRAHAMNKALMAKLGWRLLHDKTSLWARVLRRKYNVKDAYDPSWTNVKSNWSSTWRSIGTGIREVVRPGMMWVVGDGRQVRFWEDKWLLNKPLLEYVVNALPEEMLNKKACDLWRNGIGWPLTQLENFLSLNTRLRLMAVVLDDVTGAKDRLSWGENMDGSFTVKSAYSFLTKNDALGQDLRRMFDRVWHVQAPERVKVFLWLVAHQVLLTNVERQRRHLSDSGMCQVCKGGDETIIHILRDCPSMYGIWTRLVPLGKQRMFFENSLLEWLYTNLGDAIEVGYSNWATIFSMAVWWGWKWRCGNVFGSTQRCRDRTQFLRDLAAEFLLAHSRVAETSNAIRREARLISWLHPTHGWCKMNTDGASHGNPGLATAGGVLRDERGSWVGGFSLNIGICSAPLAELWGVYYGLYCAWERRVTRLELEVDSKIVVEFLTTGISEYHPLSFLVRLCYGFISRDWIVRVTHIYREANRLADGLANYAFSLPLGFHFFDSAPESVIPIMLEDANGVTRTRNLRL